MIELNSEYENTLKILLIGDSCVGKSNFVYRFINNDYNGNHLSTSGFEIKNAEISLNGKKYRLQLYDTAGQKKFESVTKTLFSQSQGFIVMFDITNEESYISAKSWIKIIQEENENGKYAPILLIGNKNDLENMRMISQKEILKYAEEEKIKYIETSSKTGNNINKAIHLIGKEVSELDNKNTSFSLNSSHLLFKKKKTCC